MGAAIYGDDGVGDGILALYTVAGKEVSYTAGDAVNGITLSL